MIVSSIKGVANMAVWGIGAYNPSTYEDYSDRFIENKCAYIGYLPQKAKTIYQMVKYIKPGDLIFIKTVATKNKQMIIKAVGIVLDNDIQTLYDKSTETRMGEAFPVLWKAKMKDDMEENRFDMSKDHLNTYTTTIFEEYNTDVINYVIQKLLNPNANEIIPIK